MHKLGAYPLALMQAANYIYENHTTTQTYLERYDRNNRLLMEQNLARREYHGRSINVALRLSLEALELRKPEAAAFLLLCGFLDSKDIFWNFLNVAYTYAKSYTLEEGAAISFDDPSSVPFRNLSPDWLDNIARDEAAFDAVVKFLCEYSFVRWNEESDGFSIHSVIHEWIVSCGDSQTQSKLLTLAANIVAANYGAQSETPAQRIQPHADRCICLGSPKDGVRKWTFTSLVLLGAFCYDNEELTKAQQLLTCAMGKVVSTFGDDSEMTALWCMRMSPMFISSQSIDTHIRRLLLAEAKLTSISSPPHLVSQYRVDVKNHLCYAYQMQGDFKRAMKASEDAVALAASGHVDLVYMCCATGLLAENLLVIKNYESAKHCANTAVGQHKQIFGSDLNDGSLSAWRRRNMTIMAIACAYLGEHELAEVILVSVHVEAVRFNGLDADLSVHAQHNRDCLREVRARQEQSSAIHSDDPSQSGQRSIEQESIPESTLRKLSTDRDITYLRSDLAMGMFETMSFVDYRSRRQAEPQTNSTPGRSWLENVIPLTPQAVAAAACLVQ